jgi:hypothetical protein
VALDRSLDILCEAGVHDRSRLLGQQCNALGDEAAGRNRQMDYCYRQVAALALDDNFGACTDPASTEAKSLAASASEM